MHSPPLTSTHSHSPKIFSHPPSLTQNNAPPTPTHPHPPKTYSHQHPSTQNNVPYTTTNSHLPKIFPHPLPPTQNNAPTTSTHTKNSLSHPTHQKYGSAALIHSPLQSSWSTKWHGLLITSQAKSQSVDITPIVYCAISSDLKWSHD